MTEEQPTPRAVEAPDFRALFEAAPALYLVLAPDLTIVGVSDAYLKATMTTREGILGRGLFDVFPDNPDDPEATGTRNLRASLDRVRASLAADTMALQKYDVRRPEAEGGAFEVRYWSPVNTPVLGEDGSLLYIIHRVEDVTEKVRADEREAERRDELRQTNQFLEAVLENIPHMVFVKDAERLAFVRFNRAGEALLGLSRADLLGKTDGDLFPAAEAAFFQAKDRETLAASVLVDIPEEPIHTRKGPRLLHTKKVPILDPDGVPRYLLGISEDVTEHRRGEEARARLAAIIEGSDDAILSTSLEGIITSWNKGAEGMFGYSAEEAIGRPVTLLFPTELLEEAPQILARMRRDERVDPFETVRRRKDGRKVDVSISLSPLRDASGRTIGLSKIARDISARREAESALAKKNEELEVAARIDRIGARVMVALNQLDEAKRPAEEVLKVLADEAGYRPLALYDHDEWQGGLVLGASLGLPPDFARRRFKVGEGLVGEAAAERRPVFVDAPAGAPFALDTGVGVIATATSFAIPLLHRETLLGVVAGATRTPILDRERSSLTQVAAQFAIGLHAIRQFQELKELSEQLNERSRKIEAQNRELAHATRLKSEFLASMSHELRTPLNAIIGFSEALKDGLLGDLEREQLDYVTEVYQSGRHLLSLINDILDLSKIEAGKMELDLEPIEIQSLIGNALTIVKERAAKGGVALTQSLAPGLTTVVADGRKLRQIVYNLLSNAVKFTPQGGAVHVEVSRSGEDVEIAVVDSGIGIAPDDLGRLFRPFEQLDGGIARKFEGTGLGLVMVKNLVELHGGTLGVESEVGSGSRFWVRLPSSRARPRDAGARVAVTRATSASRGRLATERSHEPPRVLVVDDDPAAISLAKRWLEKEGYSVDGAQTCRAAWARIQERRPDAILLDILFENGPEGWEFLERLRGDAAVADIPVVVVSIVADLGRGLALGAMQVLQKPVAGVDLLQAVEALGLTPNETGEAHRILVVDDDPRSVQHVATRLEQAGWSVTRAHGGREALAAVHAERYSAMILDLMMPEVSGFDVVRELRAHEATASLPIVILTAKVLEPSERAALERSVHSVLSKEDWNDRTFLQVVRKAIFEASRAPARYSRAPSPSIPTPPPPREGPAEERPRVLLVDHDPTGRELLRLYLEDAGYGVTLTPNGEEALAILREAPPDLIAVDLGTPGLDGGELLATCGREESLQGIPVVVISRGAAPEDALAVGAQAVVTKPIRRDEFLGLVRTLVADLERSRPYVLVVDDDPKAVKIVTSFFLDESVEIAGAHGGREGLDLVQARRPDLLILDLMMPEVSGFDVLAQLRARPETVDLPVIILTAKELTLAERETLALSVQGVFGKATTGRGDLLDQVKRMLRESKRSSRAGRRPS